MQKMAHVRKIQSLDALQLGQLGDGGGKCQWQ
ncbi:hypothetical protein SOV_01030 [Sporomusa ovata DSM 2662]|nr:hypothetical protein SOV_2c06950 [Sporomusa ovata DSM 2662]